MVSDATIVLKDPRNRVENRIEKLNVKAIATAGNGPMTSAGPAGVGYGNVGHGYEKACNSQPPSVHRSIHASSGYFSHENLSKQSIANWHRGICSDITIETT